jgi:hypothetical protein
MNLREPFGDLQMTGLKRKGNGELDSSFKSYRRVGWELDYSSPLFRSFPPIPVLGYQWSTFALSMIHPALSEHGMNIYLQRLVLS